MSQHDMLGLNRPLEFKGWSVRLHSGMASATQGVGTIANLEVKCEPANGTKVSLGAVEAAVLTAPTMYKVCRALDDHFGVIVRALDMLKDKSALSAFLALHSDAHAAVVRIEDLEN